MKRKKGLAVLVFVTMFLIGVPYASGQQPILTPVKLKVSSPFPPPSIFMKSELMQHWQEEVTKRTNGGVTFENFWGGSLGAPAEQIELLKSGSVQTAQTDAWYTPGRFPIGDFQFIFPFGTTDRMMIIEANRRIRAEFGEWERDEARQNAKMLIFAAGGEYTFLSTEPLRKLDDFKGKKLFLVGRYLGKWCPPGATAVVRPAGERYELLRTGVVTIDMLPIDLMYGFKHHEVAKYSIRTKILTPSYCTIYMNLDTFNRFSPEIQKILVETAKEAEIHHAKVRVPKWTDKIEKEWKAQGVITIEFPEGERVKWATALEDIPAEWAAEAEAKGYPGFKMVQRWQEITAELGFKWPRKWGVKK